MKPIIGWVVSIFVFLLIIDNCHGSCSPAELSVGLVPMIGISLYVWYLLFMKKSD